MTARVALALAALLAACGGGPAEDPPEAAALPPGEPFIVGTLSRVDADGRLLVEEDPGAASGSAKAWLRLAPDTPVLRRDGSAADRGALEVGQILSVWVDGPVMESYPVQAEASAVVIEP